MSGNAESKGKLESPRTVGVDFLPILETRKMMFAWKMPDAVSYLPDFDGAIDHRLFCRNGIRTTYEDMVSSSKGFIDLFVTTEYLGDGNGEAMISHRGTGVNNSVCLDDRWFRLSNEIPGRKERVAYCFQDWDEVTDPTTGSLNQGYSSGCYETYSEASGNCNNSSSSNLSSKTPLSMLKNERNTWTLVPCSELNTNINQGGCP
ncbi:hypothetical protein ElyMa_004059000 [Elysia marginata]|uniref:Uncharacterized protein n=1 Tax=Elysia marginata TaxID=1093978 RepID=A0AAV4G5H3_9GAST|nr:hypothetical protein ElyMa_004059000 [Elysia marginata]